MTPFVMTMRAGWMPAAVALALACVPAAASAQAQRAAEAQDARPLNILFIVSDDLGNQQGTYGNRVVRTPNIDRLATAGVRFDRAYVQYPWCGPSRASLMTGRRPDTLNIFNLTTHFREVIPDIVTLPQIFKRQGYFTGRVGKVYHAGVPGDVGKPGLDDPPSWDAAANPKGIDPSEEALVTNLTPKRPLGSGLSYYASPAKDEEHTDGMVATDVITMMEQQKDKPFFIAAGFYRPHHPFIAPKKYFDMYPIDAIPAPDFPAGDLDDVPPAALWTRPANWGLSVQEQREAVRGYYASVSFLDAQVGRLLDALQRLKIADRTIVVFFGDNGYALGEHGQWLKQTMFEESARVPLIIYAPKAKGNGKPVASAVELLDLYPTLAELAGQVAPAGYEGVSLVPLLNDPTREWGRPAFSQVTRGGGGPAAAAFTGGGEPFMGRSVVSGKWRYTEWDDAKRGAELYDHDADPRELHNLATDPAHAARVETLKALLRKGRP